MPQDKIPPLAREEDFQAPGDRRDPDYRDREEPPPAPIAGLRLIGLVGGPLAALIVFALPPPQGMPPEAWRLVAMAVWMVIWWLTEAIPIPATALLPMILMPLLGIGEIKPVAANYANPLIYLFLGGFLMAAGMQRVGLHRRIALFIVSRIGTSPDRIILGFMLATGFLSMWISNTATAIMMYAVGISVIDFVSHQTRDESMIRNFGVALMLSIAYSASIGGIGTLIGTPPNALLASFLASEYQIQIDFFTWMLIGVPIVVDHAAADLAAADARAVSRAPDRDRGCRLGRRPRVRGAGADDPWRAAGWNRLSRGGAVVDPARAAGVADRSRDRRHHDRADRRDAALRGAGVAAGAASSRSTGRRRATSPGGCCCSSAAVWRWPAVSAAPGLPTGSARLSAASR